MYLSQHRLYSPRNAKPLKSDIFSTDANPVDPKLGSLANKGGLTQTMALLNLTIERVIPILCEAVHNALRLEAWG
jgi:hypothetical protein